MTLTRQLKMDQLRGGLKAQVERRILEALTGPEVLLPSRCAPIT